MTQVFHVGIKQHRDWFFATSKELPGLFAGARDLNHLYTDIPECIELLLKHGENKIVQVQEIEPAVPQSIGEKIYVATVTSSAA